MKKVTIEISHKTIFFIALFALSGWLIFQIKEIIFLFFIALILVGALNPTVARLEGKGFPRWLAILLIYLFLVSILVLSIIGIFPPLIQQTGELIKVAPSLFENLNFIGLSDQLVAGLLSEIGTLPAYLVKLSLSIISNLVTIIAVLVITLYLLVEHKNLDVHVFNWFGQEGKKRAARFVEKLEKKLGGWVRAQFILMVFIGVLSYLGFLILGLEFALALGLLAGVLEIIPNIGPFLAAVPAVFFGFMISPLTGLATLAWAIIVQQIENNFLVPKVMKEAVGVNPVITLLTLAVGYKIAGVAGAVLAIPTYIAAEGIITEFFSSKDDKKKVTEFVK